MSVTNLIFYSALLSSMLLASCSQSQQPGYFESDNVDYDYGGNDQFSTANNKHMTYRNDGDNHSPTPYGNSGGGKDNLVMQPDMDPQSGMPFGYYPLPASWSIRQDGWHGPNGIKVEFFNGQSQSTYQAPYKSPKDLLQGELGNYFQQQGVTIKRTFDLPAIAASDKNYRDLLYQDNTARISTSALGADVTLKGEAGMIIIKSSICSSPMQAMWDQSMIIVSANPLNVEQAKKTALYALSNFKPNMQQVQFFQNKSNRNLADNQRHFEARNNASQSAHAAVNNATMSTYQSQSSSFDRSNQQIHNGIYNENTTTSPFDGTSHQTDAMYDRTFINAFGEQIQTNDQFYTPATGYEEVYSNDGGY